MGRTLELSNEYTRYELNRLVEFKIAGTVPGQAFYVVEPAGTGPRQAYVPDRDAGAGPIPRRGALFEGEAERRRGIQPA
jgi:hypothetical protein